MIIYFSALSKKHFEVLDKLGVKINLLRSYFELKKKKELNEPWDQVKKFFLDSGAYSAFTQKKEINLTRYCNFIDAHYEHITTFAGLDAIGDPDQTQKNCAVMYEKGFAALYTYHYGESLEVLKNAVLRYDYIAIGGMVGAGERNLQVFLQDIWRLMVNDDGTPKLKVHGFGLTNYEIIKRFPWYSIDSTTYLNGSRFGHLIFNNKQIHYSQIPEARWDMCYTLKLMIRKLHITREELVSTAILMDVFNILEFSNISNELRQNPPIFKPDQMTLL